MADEVEQQAGVRTHLGKLQAWSAGGGTAPQGLSGTRTDGAPIWTGDLPSDKNGVMCLGTPLGHADFARACRRVRMDKERGLLQRIAKMEDPLEAWAFLLYWRVGCAARQFCFFRDR